jgi:hypothetical protein
VIFLINCLVTNYSQIKFRVIFLILIKIYHVVLMTRFWNKPHHVASLWKDWKAKWFKGRWEHKDVYTLLKKVTYAIWFWYMILIININLIISGTVMISLLTVSGIHCGFQPGGSKQKTIKYILKWNTKNINTTLSEQLQNQISKS